MNPTTKKRQAVVLIHGIGEQRPIITLRSFVESVAEYLKAMKLARPDEVLFWDKPDTDSGNYETRKLTMRQGRNHSTTDFYEFYWAHHMRNTNYAHIKDWVQRVIFRRPGGVSRRLLPVFIFLWIVTLATLIPGVYFTYKYGFTNIFQKIATISTGLIATFILAFFTKLLFNYLGDAARYLDPSPGNILERRNIRMEGISLLKRLHESGKYDRVVLVGHSLGSVIAYDLVKFLWNEYYKSFAPDKFYAVFNGPDKNQLDLLESSETASKLLSEGKANVEDFQAAQQQSYAYLKHIGNKWLITDLITIGSPLTHAGHLFVYEKGLFEKLKEQREYPTCPPRFQKPDTTNIVKSENFSIEGVAHPFTVKHYNHSSPFAVTKWTNIYYASDYIGGPLQGVFGKGIKDIAVNKRNYIPIYPGGHTDYWTMRNKKHIVGEIWKILETQE